LVTDSVYSLPRARIARTRGIAIGGAAAVGAALLGAALVIGLATASRYGLTVDEFNTDAYGPKALAWYTSLGRDRSHFETVEQFLWYYGPWYQILTAIAQSLVPADPITVRHAMTFVAGIAGLAALVPIARLSVGAWAGPVAIGLCLMTGYLYGSLFFTPIDVPFLAAMCGATCGILLMARGEAPTWSATVAAGVLIGAAMSTRPGGIITHAYLLGAMALTALEVVLRKGRAASAPLARIAAATFAAIVISWVSAIALWPWLQIGNPVRQFATAYVHFLAIPMEFTFPNWGEEIATNALPWYYVPTQLFARLPEGFLLLLAAGAVLAVVTAIRLARAAFARWRKWGAAGLRAPGLVLARARGTLVVIVAATIPVAFIMVTRPPQYDGVRHLLFVIPMLAVLAGGALLQLIAPLRRRPVLAFVVAAVAAIHVGTTLWTLTQLHPLEYTAINSIAGGNSKGADQRFELDYWGAAASEAIRLLERRLDQDRSTAFATSPPRVLVCMTHRQWLAAKLFRRNWTVELEGDKADFIIDTERMPCGKEFAGTVLLDEVKRLDISFARVYGNNRGRPD